MPTLQASNYTKGRPRVLNKTGVMIAISPLSRSAAQAIRLAQGPEKP